MRIGLSATLTVAITLLVTARTVVEAQSTFRLGDVMVAPGQADVSVPISLLVSSETEVVVGWSVVVRYDPTVLSSVRIDNSREADFFRSFPADAFEEPGTVSAALIYNLFSNVPERHITVTNSGTVAHLRFCVLDTARHGAHSIEFGGPVARGRITDLTLYTDAGQTVRPVTEGGEVSVIGDPAPGGVCQPEVELQPATFFLGEVSAAPGEAGVSVPISIRVGPHAGPVNSWNVIVRYDPAVMGSVSIRNAREAETFFDRDQSKFSGPGTVRATTVYDPRGVHRDRFLTQANEGIVATLEFCTLPTAGPGAHPITLLAAAADRFGVRHETHYTEDGSDRRRFTPTLEHGSVTILDAAPVDSTCERDSRDLPPLELKGTFKLIGSTTSPGSTVTVPFFINADDESRGFSFSIDFDEEVLQATGVVPVYEELYSGENPFKKIALDNGTATPGNAGVDEGFLVGAIIFSFNDSSLFLPPGVDNRVLDFQFRVGGDATGETEIRFLDGARFADGGQPIDNIVTVNGQSVDPDVVNSVVLVPALLQIIGDISLFIRGDSTGNLDVDITDPVTTLDYLFRGTAMPRCLDAADANDDGRLDITDAIRTLGFLFLGAPPLPPPVDEPGSDPTPDFLTCRTST